MKLGDVTFKNTTGGTVTIYYKLPDQFAGKNVDVKAGALSPKISGVLLTIDVKLMNAHLSYDFTRYLPNGLWVKDESPYSLTVVLGKDSKTQLLTIKDNRSKLVGDFRPAGIM